MLHAPESLGTPFGHNSHVPNMRYAYDVSHHNGLVSSTIRVDDIDGSPLKGVRFGAAIQCPVKTGACVISATGGTIAGYDMYGQYIRETVAAAGTTKVAFASIINAPADAQWVNKFGLPYKYASAATPAMSGATFTAPASDGDARGTFVLTVAPTGPQKVKLSYVADIENLMGDPYSVRMKSPEPDSVSLAVTGTIAAGGVITVNVPASTPAGVKTTITFPDGHTVRGVAGTPVVHTLAGVWMSQYADTYDDAGLDRLIAVGFDGGFIRGTYVNLTGSLV